jgi:MFS family permease
LGPVVGGFLVDHASWRWIFYVNLPVGMAGLIFAAVVLKEHREPSPGSFDAAGFVLSALGLSGILLALAQGPEAGWTSPVVVAAGAVGLLAALLLVRVEMRRQWPMLDLRLWRDRMFRSANLTMFTTFAALAGTLFVMPFYLQSMRGLSAFESGLIQLPAAIPPLVMIVFGRRIYGRFGARRLMSTSALALGGTSALFLLVNLETGIGWIALIGLLRGLALSLALISMQTAAFATVPPAKLGRATSMFSTQRQTAAAFGVASLATLLSVSLAASGSTPAKLAIASRTGDALALQSGLLAFHLAIAGATIVALLGVVFALQLRRDGQQAEDHAHGLRLSLISGRA